MKNPISIKVPFSLNRKKLADYTAGFSLQAEPADSTAFELLDTFDWRLYEAGYTLLRHEEKLTVYRLKDWQQLETTELTPAHYLYADRLPDFLHPIVEMRAVFPRALFKEKRQPFRLLNDNAKTVVRLEWLYLRAHDDAEIRRKVARVLPVRGNDRKFAAVSERLQAIPGAAVLPNLYLDFLPALGLSPGEYSTKVKLQFTADESALNATLRVLHDLYKTARKNEYGVVQDIDTEFLHDFRVSIRRSRAAIQQITGVFRDEDVEYWKTTLKSIQQRTNRLRDLDVYLYNQQSYVNRLPRSLQPGIKRYFKELERQRQREQKTVAQYLRGTDYDQNITAYADFLQQPRQDETVTKAREPVKPVAQNGIWKRYKKVLIKTANVDKNSEAALLHRLRIQCKKLRYMMEFFQSLFPAGEMNNLLNITKTLQGDLGHFNDLAVQQEELHAMLHDVDWGADTASVAAAIGGLIQSLHNEHEHMRAEIENMLARILSDSTKSTFKSLFKKR